MQEIAYSARGALQVECGQEEAGVRGIAGGRVEIDNAVEPPAVADELVHQVALRVGHGGAVGPERRACAGRERRAEDAQPARMDARNHRDRKSTRLNSSHGYISYAVFC